MATTAQGVTAPTSLRFGIIGRSHRFAAWEAACIRDLLAQPGVKAALLIVDATPLRRPARGERWRAMLDARTLPWRLYRRLVLDRRSRAMRPVDLSAELAGTPVLRCLPRGSEDATPQLEPDDVAAIRARDLDFIMRFACDGLAGDAHDSARYGIWSFDHGAEHRQRCGPPGFEEVCRGDPVTAAVLRRSAGDPDAEIVLHRGAFATIADAYPESRDRLLFGTADWPARQARLIGAGVPLSPSPSSRTAVMPVRRAPGCRQMLRFLWIWSRAVAWRHYAWRFAARQWGVGIIDAPPEDVAGLNEHVASADLVRSARWLPEPPGRYLADPFAAVEDGRLVMLVEDYDWAAGRGAIALLTTDAEGTVSAPVTVIAEDRHLSYPHLLRLDGGLHCVAETHETERVDLYRADATLRTWTRVATLLAGVPIVDPTVFRHEGRWWLLGTRADAGANLKLFGWYADALTGPWTPHLANPLKTDVRSSRPAGPVFTAAGALYRPAQDCSTGYGAAVVVHRVTRLSPTEFAEEEVSRIAPDPAGRYPYGLHTFGGAGGRTVIDGSRRAFHGARARAAAIRKLRRLAGPRP